MDTTTEAAAAPPPTLPAPRPRGLEDELNERAVAFLMGVRAQYLRGGANPLKAWDQLSERLRAASRRSVTVEEWATSILRGLQLSGPTSSTSSALADLVLAVRTRAGGDGGSGGADTFLRLMEREWGAVIALAQLEAERRRAARTATDTAEAAGEELSLRDEISFPHTDHTSHTEDTAR